MTHLAKGLSGPLAGPELVPYVYGAATGKPSGGRPEKVLAAILAREEAAAGAALPAGLAAAPHWHVPLVPGENRTGERERAEAAERARLDAARCPSPGCRELPPNHRTGCPGVKVPDLSKSRHSCGYVSGSLGCRLACGPGAS
jgi:hypothetical protein